jgi:hypothetical protein
MLRAVWLCLFFLAGIAVAPGCAQTTHGKGIPKEIQRYCVAAWEYANENPDSFLYFSAIAQNRDPGRDKWRRLPSLDALKAASKEADSTAEVSMRDGMPVNVSFTFENQFGDSEEFAQYCYRADGSLAFIHSYLKSYHSNRGVVRDAWFGPSGDKVFSDLRVHDLQTNQIAKLPADFWDLPPPEFMHVSDLPFAHEIPTTHDSRTSR